MNTLAKETKQPEQWFVADRPIANADSDAFSHDDVAANIRMIIEQAEEDERLMIGLLGPFGVGKSTVVRLLRDQFKDQRYVVLRVSAERHELPGLHRSLIYAFAEQLVEHKFNENTIRQHLQRLEQKTSRTQTDLLTAPFAQFLRGIPSVIRRKSVVITLLVATLLIAAVAVLGAVQNWTSAAVAAVTSTIALAGGLVPAFLLLAAGRWLKNLTEPGKETIEVPRVESADEFERTFADLVAITKKKNKKLVIALDDLDRLSPGQVLEGLNVIRSFQLTCRPDDRPVFIISADEEIIEAAIARSNPGLAAAAPSRGARVESAQAFLDRLFTHRQPMPVHTAGDLTTFATRLLGTRHAGSAALGEHLQSVIDVLIHDGVQDPRHVTRLLNGFFADYRLVLQRENRAGGTRSIARGTVTDHPETLARITVFKIDFPRFHRALITDDALLARLEATATSGEDDPQAKINSGYDKENDADEWTALVNFVGRSAVFEPVSDLRPFLYLGQDELDRVIGGREARTMRDDLVSRRFGQLQDRLAGLADDHDRLNGVAKVLEDVLRHARRLDLTNAVETLTRVLDLLPTTAYPDLALAVVSAFANGAATPPNTEPLVDLAREAREPHIKADLARRVLHTDLEASTARELVVLRRRTELSEFIGPDTVTEYLDEFVSRLPSAPIDTITEWLEALDENPAPDLSTRVAAVVLEVLDGNDNDAPTEWNASFRRLLDTPAQHDEGQPAPALPTAEDLLSPSTGIIGAGLDSNASLIALTGLARFKLDSLEAQDVVDSCTDGLRASSSYPDELLWAAVFPLLRQGVEDHRREATVKASNLLLADYLNHNRGLETPPDALALLAALVEAVPSAADESVVALAESWTVGAAEDPNRAVTTLNPLLGLLDQVSAASAATLTTQIVQAGQLGADSNLRDSAINAIPLLEASSRGPGIIDQLVRANIPPVSYSANATLMEQAAQALEAAYRVHTPAPAITDSLINTYRNGIPYQQAAAITGLSTINWPQRNIADVLSFLASYPTALTVDDRRGLIRQLTNKVFDLPPALLEPLREILIADGASGSPEHRRAAEAVTARLDIADMVDIALHVPDGGQIVERRLTDDAAEAQSAVTAYVETLNGDSAPHGLSSRDVAAAIQRTAPTHFPAIIDNLTTAQIEGTRTLAAAAWRDLLQAITGSELQESINSAVNAALASNGATLRHLRSLSQGLLLAGVPWSDHSEMLLAALHQAIDTGQDEERAALLASILKITPGTKASARSIARKRYQIKGKKDAAAAAERELTN